MALKTCSNCGRVFSARRQRCPDCRRKHHGVDEEGLSRGARVGLVVIAVLAVASAAYNLNRRQDLTAELEAFHSASEAIAECHRAIETELSDRGGAVAGPLSIEYLQGGEYEARGTVALVEGGRNVTRPVYCEAQYRPDEEWGVYVELDG